LVGKCPCAPVWLTLATRRGAQIFGPPRTPLVQRTVATTRIFEVGPVNVDFKSGVTGLLLIISDLLASYLLVLAKLQ
jgi:hypothetical protein